MGTYMLYLLNLITLYRSWTVNTFSFCFVLFCFVLFCFVLFCFVFETHNLGRDDRVISSTGRESRIPFLDEVWACGKIETYLSFFLYLPFSHSTPSPKAFDKLSRPIIYLSFSPACVWVGVCGDVGKWVFVLLSYTPSLSPPPSAHAH